jgi:cell division protein FtsW (lipid II flippase)
MDGKGGLRMGSLIKKLALPAIVLLWSAAYFIEVAGYSKKNQYLIKPAFIVMVILFVVNTFIDIREWRREQESGKGASQISQEEKQLLLKSLLVVVSMAVYVILMPHIGFIITTAVLLVVLLLIMQVREFLPLILLPLIVTGILYAVFKTGLHIPLPAGFLGF